MKSTGTFSTLLSLASMASAHYTFDKLIVNGEQQGSENTYIREHTRSYYPTQGDEILENDFRCNQAATAAPETMALVAGDSVAFQQAYDAGGMTHPGPVQVYMSKAPSDAASYEGDGDWFKIHQSLLCTAGAASTLQSTAWCMYNEDRIEFDIPDTIPDGEYLIRAEHIAIHGAHEGKAEFYYACAQVSISGNSATEIPGPTTSIPGVYQPTDEEVNFSVWGSSTSYDFIPGIDVASGGTIRGSADGAGGDVEELVSSSGSSSGSTPVASADASATTTAAAATSAASSSGSVGTAAIWEQCGGEGWTGATECAEGTCTVYNQWYSHCHT